ncbi:MAG: desulfoferrodoxin [Nanoarchaeota archaeon]
MSVQKNQIYRCNVCGNIVEVVHVGGGELVCCGQPMKLLKEQTKENEGKEKHVPIKSIVDEKTIVKVGTMPHPMQKDHYIEWIELENKDKEKSCRKDLKSDDGPEAKFCAKTTNSKARCYCNKHGLWKE